ncbi:related to MCH4-monocarboxylate transporter [Ustilago bromivora]|uniref:Related to MCH4 - monocarboxylate transporter n=1 Tax=Ustilago bromivora TaxID=307758 RepID=A0A1K0G824_9BASI|nr:related to MCH4-monocarboxylate transporter [Ustilago bromivora]SYW84752.1 related to MCH4 - monocarboxylate transporter [Ustilago bromivora]
MRMGKILITRAGVESTSKESFWSLSPAPAQPKQMDGGTVAWLQVVASFLLFFNSWGLVNTYGAYQTFYHSHLLANESDSSISWIGSVQAFLLLLFGLLTGPLYDRGYLRALNIAATILIVLGMMMTSISRHYYQIMLAQGVCTGLGMGSIFIQSVAILSAYFTERRALATGIAVCGSSLGGIIYPIVFQRLQPTIGFGWATRVLAFIVLATQSVAVVLMQQRPGTTTTRPRALIDLSALTEPPMLVFSFAALLAFMGLYIPYYYIAIYSQHKVPNMPPWLLPYLVPLLNLGSVFGRLIPNLLADKFGCLNMFVVTSISASIAAYGWLSVDSVPKLILFCIFYGAFSGSYVALQGPTVAMLTQDKSRLGSRMATSCIFAAIAVLIGNPAAGAIINVEARHFKPAQILCATLIVGATMCLMLTRYLCAGNKVFVKV